MPFITTCTRILSCLGLAPHKADSWWLGHVVPHDVVIADIAGQALDIFLHGPESAHKNGIVKTNIHSHIHSHPPIHTPETNKEQTLNSPNMMPSFTLSPSCPMWWWATARKLRRCSSWLPHVGTRLGQYRQKTFVYVFNTYSNTSRQQWSF